MSFRELALDAIFLGGRLGFFFFIVVIDFDFKHVIGSIIKQTMFGIGRHVNTQVPSKMHAKPTITTASDLGSLNGHVTVDEVVVKFDSSGNKGLKNLNDIISREAFQILLQKKTDFALDFVNGKFCQIIQLGMFESFATGIGLNLGRLKKAFELATARCQCGLLLFRLEFLFQLLQLGLGNDHKALQFLLNRAKEGHCVVVMVGLACVLMMVSNCEIFQRSFIPEVMVQAAFCSPRLRRTD
mmetsp:Transcript_6033/g.11837  ORF Transcript_6033/g.11837 Transcript_6033/m.11837 type:complete len:241 (+) Transcript_6033:81-803(+)